jgi:nucleoside-diphosphate-sugar epimerase
MSGDPIKTTEQLEQLLSEPTVGVVETMRRLTGDILFLGVGGKVGPSLAFMAKRASAAAGVHRRVMGVSRFGSRPLEEQLQGWGIETIQCDLMDEAQIAGLPDAANVVFMAGVKFGTATDQSRTWAVNSYLPGLISKKYRQSRLVVFSTGNVYGLARVDQGGSREEDALRPVGEYAMSCVGRERVFEYFSRLYHLPTAVIRLNYASDLRYGVLVDVAQKVWAGHPIDLTMGYLNTIWQGDANALVLQSFNHVQSPPFVLNITGAELVRVRAAAERFGRLMGKPVAFTGTESTEALVSNVNRARQLFESPRVGTEQLIEWIAAWVTGGGPSLGKPTHFESVDGQF